MWTATATRPTWLGGYRTRHSPDRSGAEDRATHHMLNRCTGAASVPRDGKRCVLCQRLPSTTTSGNRPVLSKRALIVHAILLDAVLRFRRTGRATGRQAVTSGIGASKPVVGPRANGNAGSGTSYKSTSSPVCASRTSTVSRSTTRGRSSRESGASSADVGDATGCSSLRVGRMRDGPSRGVPAPWLSCAARPVLTR